MPEYAGCKPQSKLIVLPKKIRMKEERPTLLPAPDDLHFILICGGQGGVKIWRVFAVEDGRGRIVPDKRGVQSSKGEEEGNSERGEAL